MADEKDPTKTCWYVVVDLAIKTISAVGLVVLGIAGWLLQSGAQKQQDTIRAQETLARAYLPPLQALAQIQIAFSLIADEADLSANDPKNHSGQFGWQLRYLLDSLHFPMSFDKTKVSLTPLDAYNDRQKLRGGLMMSYKQAAALAAELNAALPIIRDICHNVSSTGLKYVKLLDRPPALYFAQRADAGLPGDQFISIDATNADAWKLWLPSNGMFVSTLCDTNFQPLYQELARGAADISTVIIELYPDLAEKAVAMRVDSIEASRKLFEALKKSTAP